MLMTDHTIGEFHCKSKMRTMCANPADRRPDSLLRVRSQKCAKAILLCEPLSRRFLWACSKL